MGFSYKLALVDFWDKLKWRSIKSASTAFVRMSAGAFSPGHFSTAKSPERTRFCTRSWPAAR
eukprot:6678213-Alexandrium_andersonii.AAC.1